jgi:transposase-like protein
VKLIMEGASMEEVAAQVGRAPRTLRTWKSEPAVKAAFRVLMRESMNRARVVLMSGAVYAASALVEMAAGVDSEQHMVVADPSRVAACKAVLETAARLTEVEDLAERIAELEAKLNPTDGEAAKA